MITNYINGRRFHYASSSGFWITIRKNSLSGAIIISYFLQVILRKVKSFPGSRSLTKDLAWVASCDRITPYEVAYGPGGMVDFTICSLSEPVASLLYLTISNALTDLFFWMRAILSSTSLYRFEFYSYHITLIKYRND